MFEHYVIPRRRPTGDEMLALCIQSYRLQCSTNPQQKSCVLLTRHTPLEKWFEAAEIEFPQHLRRVFNDRFALTLTRSDCSQLLNASKTLGELVDALIARGATVAYVEPIHLLGRPCASAGAFAALIATLRQHGVNTQHVAPSSPLTPLLNQSLEAFIAYSYLRPSHTPVLNVERSPLMEFLRSMTLFSGLTLIASLLLSMVLPALALIGLIAVGLAMAGVAAQGLLKRISPTAEVYRYEQTETVAAFCRKIAAA